MALTNSSGNLQTSYTYGPFGNTLVSGTANDNPYQYGGREADPMTGMYYLRARYLDTGLSRFVSRDPAGFQSGGHLYNYAGNAPTMATDPSGQESISLGFSINGVAASDGWQEVLALGAPTAPGIVSGGPSGPSAPDGGATSGSGGAEGAGSSSDPSPGPSAAPTPYSMPSGNATYTCNPDNDPYGPTCPTEEIPSVLGSQPSAVLWELQQAP